jgi:hypothetical protein
VESAARAARTLASRRAPGTARASAGERREGASVSSASIVGRGLLCGLFFAGFAPAQVAAPAPSAPMAASRARPAVRVLGAVDVHRVPVGESTTVLEVLIAAKWRADAAIDALLVVRAADAETMVVAVDARRVLMHGDTAANVVVQDGDLLLVPTTRDATVPKGEPAVGGASADAAAPHGLPPAQRARFWAWGGVGAGDAPRREGGGCRGGPPPHGGRSARSSS